MKKKIGLPETEKKFFKENKLRKTNLRIRGRDGRERVVYKGADENYYYREDNYYNGTYETECYKVWTRESLKGKVLQVQIV